MAREPGSQVGHVSAPADGSSRKTQSGASIVMATGRAQTETWSFHRPRS